MLYAGKNGTPVKLGETSYTCKNTSISMLKFVKITPESPLCSLASYCNSDACSHTDFHFVWPVLANWRILIIVLKVK